MSEVSPCFVDTDILLAADDRGDEVRRQQARAWMLMLWQLRRGRLSTQVLNAYYVHITRNLGMGLTQGDARAKVRRLQQWKPWQIDHQTVETAWGFEARFGLNFGDSLMLAAAQHTGCAYVLTLALAHVSQFGPLRVINPFITPATGVYSDTGAKTAPLRTESTTQ